MLKKIMLSGIQPTGALHIGNYLGALKNWENILNEYYGFFFIADYHAITIEYDAKEMQKRIIDTAIEYLACGLNLEKCSIFVQSDVEPHTELAWIFNSIIPVAELERMTQYKDKSRKNAENINAALLTYPSLMAFIFVTVKTIFLCNLIISVILLWHNLKSNRRVRKD